MKIKSILYFLSFLVIISCTNTHEKDSLLEKENELLKRELKLQEQDVKVEEPESKKKKSKEEQSKLKINIERCLILADNNKFIIKVDRLTNGVVKYTSWSKPKTLNDKPDLEIFEGVTEKHGTGGGYHYIFENGDWKYIIENNLMGESDESMGVFLRLMNKGEEKLFSRLKNLTERFSDKELYTKSDLIAMWWTPHYAIRKIYFFENDSFKFNEGSDSILNGNYTFSNRKVTLNFDSNKSDIVMLIGGGNDGYSYTLVGEGENFVKKWEE